MLILDRKPGQKIVIGKDIVLTVERVNGDRVKLTIDAPRETVIRRGEIRKGDAESAQNQ